MALEVTLRNTGLDAMSGRIDDISLHTDNPGSTGTNELTGGGYARQEPSWNPATAGVVEIDGPLVFNIPAGNVIEYVGLWEGSTWLGSGELTDPEPFNNDGELTIQTLTITLANA